MRAQVDNQNLDRPSKPWKRGNKEIRKRVVETLKKGFRRFFSKEKKHCSHHTVITPPLTAPNSGHGWSITIHTDSRNHGEEKRKKEKSKPWKAGTEHTGIYVYTHTNNIHSCCAAASCAMCALHVRRPLYTCTRTHTHTHTAHRCGAQNCKLSDICLSRDEPHPDERCMPDTCVREHTDALTLLGRHSL
jgi:hypothetical protein